MHADIEYMNNRPTEPTRINLYLYGEVTEIIRDLPSKADALAICRERGATLLSKV